MYGSHDTIVQYLVDELDINCVYFNKDYTPYAVARDSQVLQLCEKKGIGCEHFEDYYLYLPGTVTTGSGMPYKKYTPF
jgi:deoxyribodipyrimidine photo-lyase